MAEVETYSSTQVAERLGVHAQTVHKWELAGLIKPRRTPGNRRVYSEADLELLRYIRRLQREQGLRLPAIRAVLQAEGRLPQEAEEATWIDGTHYGITEAAEKVGLSIETLRIWDRLGLVIPGRYPSWFRIYSAEDIERLRYIVKLRGEGLDLQAIKRVLQLEGELN